MQKAISQHVFLFGEAAILHGEIEPLLNDGVDIVTRLDEGFNADIESHIVISGLWKDLNQEILEQCYQLSVSLDRLSTSLLLRDSLLGLKTTFGAAQQNTSDWQSHVVAILNGVEIDEVKDGGWWTLGQLAQPQSIRSALASGASAAIICSHGDGLDMRLPNAMHLCAIPWKGDLSASTAPLPYCAKTEKCYWTNKEFADPDFFEELVQPSDISARTLVLDSCLGLQTGKGLFSPEFLLARNIASLANCETLICFAGYAVDDTQRLLDVCTDIANGVSPALAIAAYNRSQRSPAIGRRAYVVHCRESKLFIEHSEPAKCYDDPISMPGVTDAALFSGDDRELQWLFDRLEDIDDPRISSDLKKIAYSTAPDAQKLADIADIVSSIDSNNLWTVDSELSLEQTVLCCPNCTRPLTGFTSRVGERTRVFRQCHNCNYYSDEESRERFSCRVSFESGLHIETNVENLEVRVRITPAGCPKHPVLIEKIDPEKPINDKIRRSCTTAFSFRTGKECSLELDILRIFDPPGYFLCVMAFDQLGYTAKTFTLQQRLPPTIPSAVSKDDC